MSDDRKINKVKEVQRLAWAESTELLVSRLESRVASIDCPLEALFAQASIRKQLRYFWRLELSLVVGHGGIHGEGAIVHARGPTSHARQEMF
jgi:hypothetical protein